MPQGKAVTQNAVNKWDESAKVWDELAKRIN
jgi:hypothetical protein